MLNFPREKRLIKKSEFDDVFNKGKKIASQHFVFFYYKNNLSDARLGLAISKKRVPKAHDRNRIKRLIRETFRCHALTNFDVVVIARQQINTENSILINQLGTVWDSLMMA
jgi:ribonuclease P protein component